MSDGITKLCILIVAMTAMTFLGLNIGKTIKGDPKSMGEPLVMPQEDGDESPERLIHVTAQMKAVPNAQLYITVLEGETVLFNEIPFAMANYMDTPPVFTLIPMGDQAAISTEMYPEEILCFIDFAKPSIWPNPPAGEKFDATNEDALARLQAFKDAGLIQDDAHLLPQGYMSNVNDRLRAQHEAKLAAEAQGKDSAAELSDQTGEQAGDQTNKPEAE